MRKLVSAIPAIMVLIIALLALIFAPSVVQRFTHAQLAARLQLARETLDQEDVLRAIDRATASIAQIVEPSVVHIETSFDLTNQSQASLSSGAGWVFDQRGHIVTNAHVVQSARRVSVEFSDGRVERGRVIGLDPYTDIAVIKLDASSLLFPAQRSLRRLPQIGERIYAFGSPFGFKFSMSEGIVSGLGREANGSNVIGGYTNYIQTDAAVNPGNSGGPIVNTDAQVIGMNVAIATARSIGESPEESGSDSAGISFAIPLGTIEPIVSQIIRHGEVRRGYLGIRYNDQDTVRVEIVAHESEILTGIRVNSVEADGPGELAGMADGDVIVAIEGSPILNGESLSSLISSSRPGEIIDVRVWRDGELIDLDVTLGKMKDEVLARRILEPIQIQMGMLLEPNAQDRITVRNTWAGLPAAQAGFQPGDVIERINGKDYEGYFSFFVLLADEGILTGETVEFLVMNSSNETRRIEMRLYW
ncbi:MAG: trypsin-like peptidase domain-containing protein [bacterium]|nr:trypsin-like peptidase domain-containing protein [bacterium]